MGKGNVPEREAAPPVRKETGRESLSQLPVVQSARAAQLRSDALMERYLRRFASIPFPPIIALDAFRRRTAPSGSKSRRVSVAGQHRGAGRQHRCPIWLDAGFLPSVLSCACSGTAIKSEQQARLL